MIRKQKIYLAGPLFSRGEMRDRIEDEIKLQKNLNGIKINDTVHELEIFNPLTFNKEITDPEEIINNRAIFFDKDIKEMKTSDIIIADIDNFDVGTILELGYFLGWKHYNKNLKIYVIYSNWKGSDLLNKFLEGAIIRESDGKFDSIEGVMRKIVLDWKEYELKKGETKNGLN